MASWSKSPFLGCQLAGIRINGKRFGIGALGRESESQIISPSSSVAPNTLPMFAFAAVFSSTVRGEEPVSLIAVEVRCAVHHCSVIGSIVGEPDNDPEFGVADQLRFPPSETVTVTS